MDVEPQVVPLVLGAGGMLGSLLVDRLERRYPATIAATRSEIDIEDRFRLEGELERLRPSVVINCAAFTDVDRCETEPDRARGVNIEGAENVARAASASGYRVIHLSTDFVFDGSTQKQYLETDPTGPLSEYGRSKLEGEKRVGRLAADHLIIRTAWLYGKGSANFVDTIRSRASEGGVLRVVDDQFGTPTSAADLAAAIEILIGIEHRGVLHFANTGVVSRYEMARAIVEIIGAGETRVLPIATAQTTRVASRPSRSALDTSLYSGVTGRPPRPWRIALEDYLSGATGPGGEG